MDLESLDGVKLFDAKREYEGKEQTTIYGQTNTYKNKKRKKGLVYLKFEDLSLKTHKTKDLGFTTRVTQPMDEQ